jgi:hypothetical protein
MKFGLIAVLCCCLSASAQTKLQPPDQVEAAKAKIAIQEVFAAEIAKAKAIMAKKILVSKILEAASDLKETPANRWSLYEKAREISMSCADVQLAVAALDAQTATFEVNRIERNADFAEQLIKQVSLPTRAVVEFIYPAAEEASAADDLASAIRLFNAGLTASKTLKKEPALERRFEQRLRTTRDIARALESAKDDDDATGRIECFRKNSWERGLPLLAKTKNTQLASIVNKDLAKPAIAQDRCDLGDVWYELAEKSTNEERIGMLRRAFHWYRLGVTGIGGIARAKLETRIGGILEEVEAADAKEGISTLWGVKPLARWRFQGEPRDTIGISNGTLKNGAMVANGRLRLKGKGAIFDVPLPVDIEEKTMEAWVYMPRVEHYFYVMKMIDTVTHVWDGILYAEQQPKKWYPGSSYRNRSRNLDAPEETAKPNEKVHVAIVYAANNSVTMYRNGKPYGDSFTPQGDRSNLQHYKKGISSLTLGDLDPNNGPVDIDEARLYNRALNREEIEESYRLRTYHKN